MDIRDSLCFQTLDCATANEDDTIGRALLTAATEGNAEKLQYLLKSQPAECVKYINRSVCIQANLWDKNGLTTMDHDRHVPLVFVPLCDTHLHVRNRRSLGNHHLSQPHDLCQDSINRMKCVDVLIQAGANVSVIQEDQQHAPELISLIHCLLSFFRNVIFAHMQGQDESWRFLLGMQLTLISDVVTRGCPLNICNRPYLVIPNQTTVKTTLDPCNVLRSALMLLLEPSLLEPSLSPADLCAPSVIRPFLIHLVGLGANPDLIENPALEAYRTAEERDEFAHIRPSFAGPPVPWPERYHYLRPGVLVDCLDSVSKVHLARVLAVSLAAEAADNDTQENIAYYVLINYWGWPSKWDEWIPASSSRLAPPLTFSCLQPMYGRSVRETIQCGANHCPQSGIRGGGGDNNNQEGYMPFEYKRLLHEIDHARSFFLHNQAQKFDMLLRVMKWITPLATIIDHYDSV